MEMETTAAPSAPSWLAIRTKAKKFQDGGGHHRRHPHSEGEEEEPRHRPVIHHPKKNKRLREFIIEDTDNDATASPPPPKLHINVLERPGGSTSSSPSSQRSCESGSSAEDDHDQLSTSTPLSAYSSTSPSPKGFAGMTDISYQYHHDHHSQPHHEDVPSFSNRISVIKSTSSYHHSRSNTIAYDHEEEPEDLSMKPKGVSSASSAPVVPMFLNSRIVLPTKYHQRNDEPETDCVQDLSTKLGGVGMTSAASATVGVINSSSSLGPKINDEVMNERRPQIETHLHQKLIMTSHDGAGGIPSFPRLFVSQQNTNSPTISLSSDEIVINENSNSSSNLSLPARFQQRRKSSTSSVDSSSTTSANGDVGGGDGELKIVDVSQHFKKVKLLNYEWPSKSSKLDRNIFLPSPSDDSIRQNGTNIVIGVPSATDSQSPKHNGTTVTTVDAEVEVDVRRGRGRRRKDEEAPMNPRFDCFLCNFTSIKESVLKNHMVRMHMVKGNRGNVKCTVCGYSCPTVEELWSHQENLHAQGTKEEGTPTTEAKVAFHACSHCTKKFRSESQLQAHLRLIQQKQKWQQQKKAIVVQRSQPEEGRS